MRLFTRKERKERVSTYLTLSRLAATQHRRRDPASLVREGYERNAIGYRCVRLIAESAACVHLQVTPDDHPAAALLNRPNSEQSGTELFEAFFGFLQTAGNSYLEAVTLDGVPRALYVLRPDRMQLVQDQSGWPSGWRYGVGRRKRLLMREPDSWLPVLHLKLFNPGDDHFGYSPLSAGAQAIDIHNAGGAWAKALIDNSARPSGALVYGRDGERLSDEQFARLKDELENAHTGAANAGRPLLLEGGLDWKTMSLSPAEMDFIQARNMAAREIALAFGVPPMLLGIPGDNTYANYREANLAFWRLSILPLVDKVATALSAWLSLRFETPVILRPDLDRVTALATEREALWTRLNDADFVDDDEKRALAGLPPREDR